MGVFKVCAAAVLTATIATGCYAAQSDELPAMQGKNLNGSSREGNLVSPDYVCEHGGLWNRYEVPFGGSVTVVVADTQFTLTHPIEDDAAYLEVAIRDLVPYTRILALPDTDDVQSYHYGDTPQAHVLVLIVKRNPAPQPLYLPPADNISYYIPEESPISGYIVHILTPNYEKPHNCIPPVPDGMPEL